MRDGHWIVRDATWRGETGSLMALVGPNGSGKSTLARVIAAHLFPTAGRCRVLGGEFGSTDLAALRRDIRLLQPAGPFDVPGSLTAREAVLTGCFGSLDLYETPTAEMERHADELLALVGLRAVARHPCWSLSGGERVRTLLARALIQRPRLLLLDEPTSGLDLAARERLLATLSRLAGGPTCVVLITHHIEEIPPVARVFPEHHARVRKHFKRRTVGNLEDGVTVPPGDDSLLNFDGVVHRQGPFAQIAQHRNPPVDHLDRVVLARRPRRPLAREVVLLEIVGEHQFLGG